MSFAALLIIQMVFHHWHPVKKAISDFPEPPDEIFFQLMGLGDRLPLAYGLVLWLQAFDNQSGTSLSYDQLNYHTLSQWLELILRLHPDSDYPLLLAGRVYSSVDDDARKRVMLNFISERFLEAPNQRWRWMAQACLIAKHGLNDLELSLQYAELLARHATGDGVPYWAKDMQIIILQEMNEFEAAQILVGALIESGEIKDPYQLRFLQNKLKELQSQKGF